jgi:hypothetical protein
MEVYHRIRITADLAALMVAVVDLEMEIAALPLVDPAAVALLESSGDLVDLSHQLKLVTSKIYHYGKSIHSY